MRGKNIQNEFWTYWVDLRRGVVSYLHFEYFKGSRYSTFLWCSLHDHIFPYLIREFVQVRYLLESERLKSHFWGQASAYLKNRGTCLVWNIGSKYLYGRCILLYFPKLNWSYLNLETLINFSLLFISIRLAAFAAISAQVHTHPREALMRLPQNFSPSTPTAPSVKAES